MTTASQGAWMMDMLAIIREAGLRGCVEDNHARGLIYLRHLRVRTWEAVGR